VAWLDTPIIQIMQLNHGEQHKSYFVCMVLVGIFLWKIWGEEIWTSSSCKARCKVQGIRLDLRTGN